MKRTVISQNDDVCIYDSTGDWKQFLKSHPDTISVLRREKDHSPYVLLDISEILKWSLEYASDLINEPTRTIGYIKDASKQLAFSEYETVPNYPIYFTGSFRPIPIRDIRSKHLGKLISIEGMIKKGTEAKPTLETARFQCDRCQALISVLQTSRLIQIPKRCTGDCRSSKFTLLKTMSDYVDTQRLLIQETPESTSQRGQPQDIELYASNHIVGRLLPGQRVTINGILMAEETQKGSTALHKYIKVLGYEHEEGDYNEIQISEEEEEEILNLAKRSDVREQIIKSISPSIYGYEIIKEAIALQAFGGVAKTLENGKRYRGDIHILMVGDPGTAKSDMLRDAYERSPRSVITSGKSSSTAGLTATVTKDEFGEGHWTLDAGALVIADGGLACIDEIAQIDQKELSALHEAMEQQRVSIAKAGILASLWCRCGILAAANPQKGRFDMFIPISDQIRLPPPVLSRFDLIFIVEDRPEPTNDERVADHILGCHISGSDGSENCLESEFLRKYLAYSRKIVAPKMTPEAGQIIKEYYLSVRNQSSQKQNSPVATTPRQLQALIRLAEANARMKLSSSVLAEDAKLACQLTDKCLREVAYDKSTETYDVDKIATGISHTQRQIMVVLQENIKKICEQSEGGYASRKEIYESVESHGIDRGVAEQILEKMLREQIIYEPRRDLIKWL